MSVVLVAVMSGCSSDSDEDLPYRDVVQTELAEESPLEEAPTFSDDVLKSEEFRICLEHIYVTQKLHFHQYYDHSLDWHTHGLTAEQWGGSPNRSLEAGNRTMSTRSTGRMTVEDAAAWQDRDVACGSIFSSAP